MQIWTPAKFKAWFQQLRLEQTEKPTTADFRDKARTIANKIADDLSSGFNASNEGKVMRILNETDTLRRELRSLLNSIKQDNKPK